MSYGHISSLERIMSDALEDHDAKVRIDGRSINNLRLPMTLMLSLR